MGLDSVELVLMCEERFGVEIPDAEAAQSFTPRKLAELIFSKLKATDVKICQTQRAFYLLRRALMRTLDLPRERITLDTPLRDLMPQEDLREVWPLLEKATRARCWPDLVRPPWMRGALLVVWLVFAVLILALVQRGVPLPFIVLTTPVALMAAGILVFPILRATRAFKRCLPPKLKAVRDLVPGALTSDEVPWTLDAVSQEIKQLVIAYFKIPESRYAEDKHFITEIGLDG